jgi:predicted DsbA family dithiol-disulfide isomerase
MKITGSPKILGLTSLFVALCFASSARAASTESVRASNAIGPANAPVLIEFFSDLQCPMCARYEPIVKTVRTEFGDKTRMVLRHFPVSEHPHAVPAAWAAEALYKTQWMWAKAPAPRTFFRDQAKQLGLDLDKFEKDMDSDEVHDRVSADRAHAQKYGVKTVPSVVINGLNIPDSQFNEDGFRAAITSALTKASR